MQAGTSPENPNGEAIRNQGTGSMNELRSVENLGLVEMFLNRVSIKLVSVNLSDKISF